MLSIGYILALYALAAVLALLEIQIEGRYGWAEKLPCHRPAESSFLARLYFKFTNKPLTGYHIVFAFLILFILHLPFFAGICWTKEKELITLSAFFIVLVCEDFLWFLYNPFYGVCKFNKHSIWWHRKWLGPCPIEYPLGVLLSFILALLASLKVLIWWLHLMGIFLGITLLQVGWHIVTRKKMA
ncbi:MAG: hypothetical protein LR000_01415 [Candidatus Pacebacteria bacterium]|nr:hypothetical protein [Candidatus Paceibacterota bacterium]